MSDINDQLDAEVIDPPATDPAPASDPAPADLAPATAADPPTPEPEQPKREPWFTRRIDDLTREKYELREQLAREKAERETLAAMLGRPAGETPQPENTAPRPAAPSPAPVGDVEARAATLAQQMLRQQQFNDACNAVVEKGAAAFGDKFNGALGNLGKAGVISNEDSSFIEAALATEAPEKVLYELGNNPEEAMRIAALPPIARGIAMDRMARELAAPKSADVSKAPPPITPIDRSARKTIDLADPDLDYKTWYETRQKQIQARQGR